MQPKKKGACPSLHLFSLSSVLENGCVVDPIWVDKDKGHIQWVVEV